MIYRYKHTDISKVETQTVMRKIQIETTLRFPVSMSKINKTSDTLCSLVIMWNKGNTHPFLLAVQLCIATETVWQFLRKIGINLFQDPAIPLLGIYPKDSSPYRDNCLTMLIAALFIIARNWKQPKWPATQEVYLHNGVLVSC